jgi:phosphomannomutase/phosphoglucomutase
MALIAVVLLAAAGAGLMLFRRKKGGSDARPAEKDVTYTGAVKAIIDGEHPGLAKLVPGLKGKIKDSGETDDVTPLSQGLEGDDITRIKVPPKDDTPHVDLSAEMDLDLTAESADPMFDLTAGEGEDTGEPEPAPVVGTAKSARPAAKQTDSAASVFRAYDIRGIVGKTLTVELVYDIGRALGSESQKRGQKTMVVGRDGRHSGPDLIEALIRGLSETGTDVIDIGMVPTPVLYFATYFLETGSGVMVTGSHNPPDYNGLKMMIGGDTLFGDDITALYTRIQAGDFVSGSGSVEKADIGSEYIRRVTEDIPVALGNSYKVVVDCGNGVAGVMAPQLIRALGHDVVDLYCEVDGNFPNHHPDPSQPENLQALIAKVKETHADLGLAFDGDGDRLGVVDAEGHVIWPDRQMMLYAADVLSRNPGAEIIYDVKCSRHLRACIEEHGGKPLMWKTGHSFIKTKMKESGAPLAGEMSGHIFFKERWYGFDDAIYTAARLLEILLGLPGSPTEILSALPTGVTTPELRLDLSEERHGPFMQQLVDNADFKDAEISHIDGLRADFPNGWGLIRASNTTPCLILRFEGDDEAAMQAIQEQFKTLIQSLDDTLNIPF